MLAALGKDIARLLESEVLELDPLQGGSVGQVFQVRLANGSRLVAKVDNTTGATLQLEGFMLNYLAEHSRLPVPAVLHVEAQLLLMEFLPGRSSFSKAAQENAAELLADLHQIRGPAFGLDRDTLIGGLHQPNPWSESWLEFFRDQRLLYMAREARRVGRLPGEILARVERLGEGLDEWLHEPERPALIHGDAWTGNILAEGSRITGFLDPAVYYAHPEIELAFTTLFGTFGKSFFGRYEEILPLQAGFHEERRDIYNLYPLLVHVRLFGGSYVSSVARILERFGY